MTSLRQAAAQRRQRGAWVLALLAAFAYAAAVAGDFVFDDIHSIAGNPALHDLSNLERLLGDPSAFSGTGNRMYRPVLLVSLALNLAISPAAWSIKCGNVLLHVATTLLALGWLRRLGVPFVGRTVALALFAVHPLLAEAINLGSARSELLLVFGLLLALRSQQSWLANGSTAARCWAMAGMLLGGVVACGSKETGVVLPGLLFAQAWCTAPQRLSFGRLAVVARDLLPVGLLVLGYLLLRHELFGHATVALAGRSDVEPSEGWGRSMTTQLATMGLLLPRALLQMLVPVGLSFDPPVAFQTSFAAPAVLAGWAGVLGLCWVAWGRRHGAPARRTGVVLAVLVALPWIVVPLNMPLAEHRLYGPLLGIAAALAPSFARWWQRARHVPTLAVALRSLAALVVVGFGGHAAVRSLDYRDERLLWRDELAARPEAWRAWWGLGMAELRYGDPVAAVRALACAVDRKPNHQNVRRNYTEALLQLPPVAAQPWRAVVASEQFLALVPDDPWAHALAADAQLQAGRADGDRERFVAAERLALRCLQLGEPKALVFRLAASAQRELGDPAAALAHLDECLRRGLDFPAVRAERAAVLAELGQPAAARRELQQLQQAHPFDPAVQRAVREFAAPGR